METNCENEIKSSRVADAISNGTSTEAAEALSQALLPMNHKDYSDFLNIVKSKTDPEGNILDLDPQHNLAHLWARRGNQPDYVIVTPGQNLTKICKSDFDGDEPASQKTINSCIDEYSKLNKLEDPDFIMAGNTLKVPFFPGE